ncbi:DgyrCDS12354 [Dimorphilus gyrociliatus]|uniref:DgyrCDS12354 n=1 Tax=Dimorphilus gyrociliatus TaxID=2664684 RepID=A0A7I8W678_9ANNE|nr:DgyrCDS12354 [Dimorphilus gyrociliatus]
MGNLCTQQKVGDVAEMEDKADYPPPEQINNVCGTEVNRDEKLYLYALFCCTRLANAYTTHKFPNISCEDLDKEDYINFLNILNEMQSDLVYEENLSVNAKVDSLYDQYAKQSLKELAYYYGGCTDENSGIDMSVIYDDTLKMVIADMISGFVWKTSSLKNEEVFS